MFAYALNNPVSLADDGGEAPHVVAGAVVGALVGVASQAICNFIDGKAISDGMGRAALVGALGGGLTAAFPGSTTLISSGLSAAESIFSDIKNGENFATIAVNATISAGFAAATSGPSVFSNKNIVSDTLRNLSNLQAGNHPGVKKKADKLIWKTVESVVDEFCSGVQIGVVVNYVSDATKWTYGLITGAK